MNKPNKKKVIYTICRIVLGGVFIYASWIRILYPDIFARLITNFHIVGPGIAGVAAIFLPWLELVCGICLITNRWAQAGALITASLLVMFMGVLVYIIYQGIDVRTGAFTMTEKEAIYVWMKIFQNIILLAMAFMVVFYQPNKKKIQIQA